MNCQLDLHVIFSHCHTVVYYPISTTLLIVVSLTILIIIHNLCPVWVTEYLHEHQVIKSNSIPHYYTVPYELRLDFGGQYSSVSGDATFASTGNLLLQQFECLERAYCEHVLNNVIVSLIVKANSSRQNDVLSSHKSTEQKNKFNRHQPACRGLRLNQIFPKHR